MGDKKETSVLKRILLQELEEQVHPEKVEDVIFWALEFYAKNHKPSNSWGCIIASTIVSNILEAESEELVKDVMSNKNTPCGDCSKRQCACRSINCQYKNQNK